MTKDCGCGYGKCVNGTPVCVECLELAKALWHVLDSPKCREVYEQNRKLRDEESK